ncbi:putative kinase, partial [Kappamyces sp. JEL0680]
MSTVEQLAQAIAALAETRPVLVGIGGIPGSGKSTLAAKLEKTLSCRGPETHQRHLITKLIPMDGYHYPKSQLSQEQLDRRGAHYTFDGEAFVQLVKDCHRLLGQDRSKGGVVYAHDWNHAVGDPSNDAIAIGSDSDVVLVEGLHLFLDQQPWTAAIPLFDVYIWVDTPLDVAMARLAARHVLTGLEPSPERAALRV